MFKYYTSIFIFLSFKVVFSQNPNRPEIDMDKFVQDLFSQQSDNANYETMYESLFQFYRYPIDLNKATREELENLYILSPSLINNFLQYRNTNGNLLSIYELQAIKGFEKNIFEKLLPFVKIQDDGFNKDARNLWQRIKSEENSYAIVRHQQTLEPTQGQSNNMPSDLKYKGNASQIFARYRVQSTGDFSLGITMKKDPGEAIAWNPNKKQYGMDYYSFHFAMFNKGRLKALTIGDYQVQIGQGLVMSSGFYLGKGAEPVTTIKRSNQGLRPYTGAMETGFLRGAAATLNYKNFDWTNFVSYRKLDGNVRTGIDSLSNQDDYISSILRFGLHRNERELATKGTIGEAIGGSHLLFSTNTKNLKIGLNSVFTHYDIVFNAPQRVYNLYDFRGNSNINYGIDFSYNYQNFSFFGEYSRSKGGGNGLIAGVLASVHPKIDLALLVRNYDSNFYSFYGNTFGEISVNRNERGIYWGAKYTASRKFNFVAYFDKFAQPWLTLRAEAPTEGFEYRLRINYMPTKKITLYVQYIEENKQANKIDNITPQDYVVDQKRTNWLFNMDFKAEKILSLKSRVQLTSFQQEGGNLENGIMMLQDVNFDFKKFKFGVRFSVFDSENFNTRLYVFERNVLYAFSMPLYQGVGTRSYLILQYKITKHWDFWAKIAGFQYRNIDKVSAGLNEIDGNTKTDVTLQIKYSF